MTEQADADLVGIERELNLLSRHFLTTVQHRDVSLDRSGYLLLGRLELEQPMSLRALAEAFRLDLSTINRQVAALRRRGLVERITDPGGGAAHLYRPTADGLQLLRRDRAVLQTGIEHVVGGWSAEQRAELHAVLLHLNTSIERLESRPWPRP